MRPARYIIAGLCAVVMALALTSCEREQRQFRAPPAARGRVVTLSELHPGLPHPEDVTSHPYEQNAYALAEGQRLFT
jgi:hypothetical protein